MQPFRDELVDRDSLRARFLVYTRRAYTSLPPLKKPRILDIGCGTGVPTLELARLSDGEIVGIDVDEKQLFVFSRYIHDAGLEDRVSAVRCSMQHIAFADGLFDIVWAEGSIAVIGFQEGLKRWRRVIKTGGYLVLHDNVDNVNRKRQWIAGNGYMPVDDFVIAKEVWWDTYYKPLQEKVEMLKTSSDAHTDVRATIHALRNEIDQFHNNPAYHGSAFFIMQKGSGDV